MSNPETIARFKVQGMHCQSCATSVTWEIEDIEGVADATTSLAEEMTEVRFDPSKVDEAAVIEAIRRAGFTAVPAA